MQHNPSWDANRFSASLEIPQIVWNLKAHYFYSQEPTTCPYAGPDEFSPHSTILFL